MAFRLAFHKDKDRKKSFIVMLVKKLAYLEIFAVISLLKSQEDKWQLFGNCVALQSKWLLVDL